MNNLKSSIVLIFLTFSLLNSSRGFSQQCDANCLHEMQVQQENSRIFWEDFYRDLDVRIERRNQQIGNDNANRLQNWWGSIAVNVQTGKWFWVSNLQHASDAVHSVLQGCTNNECIPVATFKNTCVAVASNANGGLFWADDIKQNNAGRKAIQQCQANDTADKSCTSPKENTTCSGYNYSKWQGKTSNFNRGGLIGMMSPKLMGIPDLQPPEVIYDPAMVDFTSQPAALKLMASGATALQPLWMAISLSPRSDMGMKVGVTKAIAEANAKKECGASDCQILLSFQGDSCTAMGSGKSTAGQSFIYMELGATEQEAKKNTLKKCKDTNSVSCEIHVAQCHDLTP